MGKIIVLLCSYVLVLLAHKTGLSYVDLQVQQDYTIDVTYKKPFQDIKAKDIIITYPLECKQISKTTYNVKDGYAIEKYSLFCGKKALWHKRIWVEGLVTSDRGVMIYYKHQNKTQNALLRATTPFVQINDQTDTLTLFFEYIKLGILHILSGFDHLLFVFAILLLAQNTKKLLIAITAFTASHSITLACGILGIINIPTLFVEAMIALSIIFLARELLFEHQNSLTKKHLWIVTFIFGLLHGFGFSNVLATIGLPQNEIPLSLFAFNLGIELGQLLFVIFMISILFFIKKINLFHQNTIHKTIAYFIGITASFWLIERIILF